MFWIPLFLCIASTPSCSCSVLLFRYTSTNTLLDLRILSHWLTIWYPLLTFLTHHAAHPPPFIFFWATRVFSSSSVLLSWDGRFSSLHFSSNATDSFFSSRSCSTLPLYIRLVQRHLWNSGYYPRPHMPPFFLTVLLVILTLFCQITCWDIEPNISKLRSWTADEPLSTSISLNQVCFLSHHFFSW